MDITQHREPRKRSRHEGATSFSCGCILTLRKCVQFSHAETQYSLVESTNDKAVVCRTLAVKDDPTVLCSSCFLVLCFFLNLNVTFDIELSITLSYCGCLL